MTFLEGYTMESGKSRYEIAQKAGVSYASVAKYFTGSASINTMPLATAVKLAKVMNKTLDEFYSEMIEAVDMIEIKEGWNEMPSGFSFFLDEDGTVSRGLTSDNEAVYPYLPGHGGLDLETKIPLKRFMKLMRNGDISWN